MYDVIVIGSGPGGYVAAIRASQLGLNTAVVERSELGGVCLNWGCIPTKALLKSVQALHYAQDGNEYGFEIAGEIKPNLEKIVERSRGVANGMSRGIDFLFKKNKVNVITGNGKIKSAGEVEVTSENGEVTLYQAKNIIIATGARANSLPSAPIDGNKLSHTVMHLYLNRFRKVWRLLVQEQLAVNLHTSTGRSDARFTLLSIFLVSCLLKMMRYLPR